MDLKRNDEQAANAAALDEVMRGPPYTPRAFWPRQAQDPVKAYKTRLHRDPAPVRTEATSQIAEPVAKRGGDMLRAVRAAG